VASYKNGIGNGPWTHIDGWSDSVIEYIRELESIQPE
jgi:60 kDa SS-A/Ro ribonucleoprotein